MAHLSERQPDNALKVEQLPYFFLEVLVYNKTNLNVNALERGEKI